MGFDKLRASEIEVDYGEDDEDSDASSQYTDFTGKIVSKSAASDHHVIADKLSRVVSRWRTCVIVMLLMTSSLVVTSSYLFLSDNEEKQFQKSVRTRTRTITLCTYIAVQICGG